ncbi:hypothetical protein I3760_04G130200 [Carya illinoinensis]|nr:hypothetical protein I3760_04G130200 [Carya illinoinensis]
MIAMDVKGITWVGNIYQKFEAMCLEVEEVMYQDTVKYVENQVQNVGESVKKFYSDVVQDLVPPSSVDPVKALASDLSVDRYSDVGIHKNSKEAVKKVPVRVDVDHLTENSKVIVGMDKDFGRVPSLRKKKFSPSSVDSVKGTCPKLCSGQHNNGSISNNSNMGVKNGPGHDNFSATEMSEGIVNDLGRASSCLELLKENHGASCDHTVKISAPALAEVRGFDSISESSNALENAGDHMSDPSIASASPDLSVLASFVRNEGKEMRLPDSDGLSAEPNAVDICTFNGASSLVGLSLDSEVRHNEFDDMEVVSHPERSDDWGLDGIESTLSEPGVETSQQYVQLKLEETCVLVDGDELHFVLHKEGKRRPYKKKIREAFSSRMRSARKEYEQLAVWYGYDGESNQASSDSSMATHSVVDTKETKTQEFSETEWELL